jgi:6-phospho-beta-glucosidase
MPTQHHRRAVITIVGGGAFAPSLCDALARMVDLPNAELRLFARRQDRLRILAEHSRHRLAAARPGWSVRPAPSLEAAVEGATIVVLLVRVGGLEARAWDEAFPQRFGLAGDEGLGPGGIANAWRTLPELARIAQALHRMAPGARVVNLMSPLGMTTRLLLEHGLDAFGVCELPLATIESWLSSVGASAAEATWRYGGLNHLGWFWDVRFGHQDLLTTLAAATPSPGDPAPVDRATVFRYGAAPLRYFYEIFDREAGRRLGLERAPGRARQLTALSDALVQRFSAAPGVDAPEANRRPTPWLDRAITPIVSALLTGQDHTGFVNLRNDGRIPELPPDAVVELSATFSSSGPNPVMPGPLPERVAEFLRRASHSEELSFLAAKRQDPELLEEAIRALPLPIPESRVVEMGRLARLDSPFEPSEQESR